MFCALYMYIFTWRLRYIGKGLALYFQQVDIQI